MKKALLLVGLLASLAACAHTNPIPSHTAMPVRTVTEASDEWLHDHCDVKGVEKLDGDAIEPKAISLKAQFVEVLYKESDGIGVVMFACRDPLPPQLE